MELVTSTQTVIKNISHTEGIALKRLLEVAGDSKTFVVTGSKLMDKNDLARSVINNMFGKLEVAGLLRTWSLGVKGTRCEILNAEALQEISKKVNL